MIKFLKHRMLFPTQVKVYKCKAGCDILKILFHQSDVHISRSGKIHLDIWGKKLEELKEEINK